MTNTVDVECFIQIDPDWERHSGHDRPGDVRSAKAVSITQNRSKSPKPGTLTTKLTLRIPKAAFLPLAPEAVVVIPAELLGVNQPVEVIASDANQQHEKE